MNAPPPFCHLYEKYLQIDRNDHFAENTFEFPLIAAVEEDELLRHTITVEPDELDHPDTPATDSYNILFADNGLGILVTTSADGIYRWFFIDSRRDDDVDARLLHGLD